MENYGYEFLIDQYNYHKYLLGVSFIGRVYRKFILHRCIEKEIRGSFVDIGCGLGDLIQSSSHKGTGFDINPFNIAYLKRKGIEAQLIDKTGRLPLGAKTVETVVLDNVLEHLDNPHYLLGEIKRIMRRNGRIIILVPCSRGYRQDSTHKIFYDKDGLREVLSMYELEIINERYLPLPLKWAGDLLAAQTLMVVAVS